MVGEKPFFNKSILVIFVVFIVVIGAFLYFCLSGSKEISKVAVQPESNVPSVANSESNSNADVSKKTYKNDKYGYEIDYPSSWYVYDTQYDGEKHQEDLNIQNFSRPKDGGFSGIGGAGCQFNIWAGNDKYNSVKDWISARKVDLGKDLENTSEKERELGGVKGEEVVFTGSFEESGKTEIVLPYKGAIYEIRRNWQDVSEENCQPFFDDMLSSFTFLK